LTPSIPDAWLSVELSRAYNDWTSERWLRGRDARMYGLIIVPNQVSEAAVAEIARMAQEPRMVGVLMAANGLSKPLGHPAYHAISSAAAAAGLPVVTHGGGERVADTLVYPTAAGMPSTVSEYRAMRDQAQASYLVSMLGQGVFELLPSLR